MKISNLGGFAGLGRTPSGGFNPTLPGKEGRSWAVADAVMACDRKDEKDAVEKLRLSLRYEQPNNPQRHMRYLPDIQLLLQEAAAGRAICAATDAGGGREDASTPVGRALFNLRSAYVGTCSVRVEENGVFKRNQFLTFKQPGVCPNGRAVIDAELAPKGPRPTSPTATVTRPPGGLPGPDLKALKAEFLKDVSEGRRSCSSLMPGVTADECKAAINPKIAAEFEQYKADVQRLSNNELKAMFESAVSGRLQPGAENRNIQELVRFRVVLLEEMMKRKLLNVTAIGGRPSTPTPVAVGAPAGGGMTNMPLPKGDNQLVVDPVPGAVGPAVVPSSLPVATPETKPESTTKVEEVGKSMVPVTTIEDFKAKNPVMSTTSASTAAPAGMSTNMKLGIAAVVAVGGFYLWKRRRA